MAANGNILLVIDDESAVCRALRRLLGPRVDQFITAETAEDALTVLETRSVTHVLCDFALGPGQPNGIDMARQWKTQFSSLKKVIVITGTNAADGECPEGIDRVIGKATDPDTLMEYLAL